MSKEKNLKNLSDQKIDGKSIKGGNGPVYSDPNSGYMPEHDDPNYIHQDPNRPADEDPNSVHQDPNAPSDPNIHQDPNAPSTI